MSTLRHISKLLDKTNARELLDMERDDRRRLADQFRAWAFAAEHGLPPQPLPRRKGTRARLAEERAS